ncbi:MAG: 23S rRNA pseudouridine(955/2504/2580) synthase RluC [Methylococcaceae bacterium]|nr:MAG: 23S rRNA pseudouridine(955/2504/2580) synthase RluC [Methylococcaceae bacterium]
MPSQPADIPRVQMIEIPAEFAGQRLDNFLFTRLKGVPKSRIYRMLRSGEVRINGSRVRPQDRVQDGDKLRIPPVRVAEREEIALPTELLRKRLDRRILFEDDAVLVLNKPVGMPVHGGSGASFGVIEGLRHLRPEARFLELVHRLDRETSGLLLIAKKRSALRVWHELFREDRVEKRYLALLAGAWAHKKLMVDAPLEKNVAQGGERMVRVSRQGKPAQTDFRRLERFSNATLVEAAPVTGRTHQIRVHAAHLGHPIAGDERYGQEESNREFRRLGLKRLFLHAAHLVIAHPVSGVEMRLEAPLEPELENFLKQLKR